MYKVFVGDIAPEALHILTTYLDNFMPGTEIEPLTPQGIKGKMKNHAVRQDVLFVILDDSLWEKCTGVLDNILALDKVHKYVSDPDLDAFLASKFGPLDTGVDTIIPPDQLLGVDTPEEELIPKAADFSKDSAETVPPEIDTDFGSVTDSEEFHSGSGGSAADNSSEIIEDLNRQISDLQSQIIGKETLIRNLTMQLQDKSESEQDDIAALIGRIRELENELEQKNAQMSASSEESYVNLGKVARAEQILSEFDDVKAQLKAATEERSSLEKERDGLKAKLDEAQSEAEGLQERISQLEGVESELATATKRVGELETELSTKVSRIEELESENSGLEAATADHKGVVSELAQLRAETELLQQEVKTDREKMRRLEEERNQAQSELSQKQLEVDNLSTDIHSAEDKISQHEAHIEQLTLDLQLRGGELETVKKQLAEAQQDLEAKAEALAAAEEAKEEALTQANSSSEYNQSLVENADLLSKRITELTEEVTAKASQIETLMSRLDEAQASIAGLTQRAEAAESALDSKNAEYEAKVSECAELQKKLSGVREELSAKTAESANVAKQLHELEDMTQSGMATVQSQLDSKQKEIDDLTGRMSAKDTTIATLTTDIAGLHEQLTAKDGEITQMHEQVAGLRKQLIDAQSSGNEAQVSADTQRQALEKVIAEKKAVEDKLVASESKRIEQDTRIAQLEGDLQQERSFRGSVDDSNVELAAQNEKLQNRIKQLEGDLIRQKADDEMVSRLESDLLEERRKSARLQSEVDVLKRTSDGDKASDMRVEIVRLKNELLNLQGTTVSATEAESLRNQLKEARERSAQLELSLVEKDSQINAVQSNVFSQLRNLASPKGAYDFKFGQLTGISDKFVCIASGSEESTANVYQVLRSACQAAGKNIVIVDIVTDSSIDRAFGIKRVKSPIDWLEGKSNFKPFLADTQFGNVKVLSTALAYINDLFLMNVDWQSRLSELGAFSANVVVLYIGCLNNLVTKVLFKTFSEVMKTYVVCKATPANLRTTILNLTGFINLSANVTVECVNFSDTSSAAMYQRLCEKYNAQVLRDNEVLRL